MPRFRPIATVATVTACAALGAPYAAAQGAQAHRAIVVSIDSFNERRVTATIDAAAIPALSELFARGACADHSRTAFPSMTAPGHAALWTGAWGDVTGIAANAQAMLPRGEHTLNEFRTGFAAGALRAEPLWVTVARAGKRVVTLQATQSPGAPGYPSVDAPLDGAAGARHAENERVLAGANASILTAYNHRVATSRLITAGNTHLVPARGWLGIDRLPAGSPAAREFQWLVGTDTLYAFMTGAGAGIGAVARYDRLYVALARDLRVAIELRTAPPEMAPLAGRELARHFSAPLVVRVAGGGRALVAWRLFSLASDGTAFDLFQPELAIIEANRPAVAAAFDAAVGGLPPDGATPLWQRGGFGPTFFQGGDGTAEARWMETMEYVARQFMRAVDWAWRTQRPDLLVTYVPIGDEADHALYGYIDTNSPLYDAGRARRATELRIAVWALVDRQVAQLQRLVADDRDAALFVVGDHGMRAVWRVFRPNVALGQAGLFATDSAGRIQLDRTKALSTNGYFVTINRTAWKGGIVPPAGERAVLDAAEQALLAVRDADGNPVVTRTYRADAPDSLGIGGPVGGDLYYEVAPGFRWAPDSRGALTAIDGRPSASHGFAPTAPDMWTVFCAWGASFAPHRTAEARNIDVAPTVSEWLGTPAPPDARGRSVLGVLHAGGRP